MRGNGKYQAEQAESARLQRNEVRAKVRLWMSAYQLEHGRIPTVRETGAAFGKSGTWAMILLRMAKEDERDRS